MTTETRVYYKIRFPDKAGTWGEWHHSNNGTDSWVTEAKIKSILTRGIQSGYKGKTVTPLENYEVVRFTETVNIAREVVSI